MSEPKVFIRPPVKVHRYGKYEGQLFTITYKVKDLVQWILKNYHQVNELSDKKGYFDIIINDDNRLTTQTQTDYLHVVDGEANPNRPQEIINHDIELRWINSQRSESLDL